MEHKFSGNDLVVMLSGELDLCSAPKIKDEIDSLIDEHDHIKFLFMDLKSVLFIDSSGLGMIIGRHKRIMQQGGRVILCYPSPSVKKALVSCGLDKLIEIIDEDNNSSGLAEGVTS